jgi:hypothetical protein
MMATTPASVTMSATIAESPLVNASLTASTSLSTRVISRPTGFRRRSRASRLSTCGTAPCEIVRHALPGELHEIRLDHAQRVETRAHDDVEDRRPA